ncbi:MAG: hypothetical protein ACXVFN_21150 [Solirubrobacteraceae bacterium]
MLDETVVGALDGAFAGVLIGPGDPAYESARRVWNSVLHLNRNVAPTT